MDVKSGKGARPVGSVLRALDLLESLAESPEGLPLKALAARLGAPPQTAQSLLRTLQARGYAEQAGRGAPYRLGEAAHRLARVWKASGGLAERARPAVLRMARELGEYALLAEMRAGRLARLVETHPHRSLMVAPGMETSGAMHTMATARVLLAWMDEAEREAALANLRYPPRGPRAPRDEAAFRRALAATRRRGYAECLEESSIGCAALAWPVRDGEGRVVAALGVALPLARYGRGRRAEVREAVRRTAEDLGGMGRRTSN